MSASALLPAGGVQVVFIDEAGAKQSGALEVLWNTGFERVLPVRSFGSFRGQRSFQGWWWFATTGEHVGFESWVERDAVMLLDFDPDVVAVSSQPFCLRWAGQPGARRHVPDYFGRDHGPCGTPIRTRAPANALVWWANRQSAKPPRTWRKQINQINRSRVALCACAPRMMGAQSGGYLRTACPSRRHGP